MNDLTDQIPESEKAEMLKYADNKSGTYTWRFRNRFGIAEGFIALSNGKFFIKKITGYCPAH